MLIRSDQIRSYSISCTPTLPVVAAVIQEFIFSHDAACRTREPSLLVVCAFVLCLVTVKLL